LVKNGNSGKGVHATLTASKDQCALQEEHLHLRAQIQLVEEGEQMNKKLILLVIGLYFSLVLAACGSASSSESNFPTGKFVLPGTDESEGVYFNKDGTFTAFYYGADVAKGTYTVRGDLYIEVSSDQNCG
jgi:hypothetical protein